METEQAILGFKMFLREKKIEGEFLNALLSQHPEYFSEKDPIAAICAPRRDRSSWIDSTLHWIQTPQGSAFWGNWNIEWATQYSLLNGQANSF